MDELRAVDALAPGWVVAVLLLGVGVLAWVNIVSPRQWGVLARSFGAWRLGRHRLREGLDLRDRTLTALALLSVVVIALFLYQALVFHQWIHPGVITFLGFTMVMGLLFLVQLAVLSALRLLPATDEVLREYLYTVVVFHVVLGLVLLPVTIILSFPERAAWRPWVVGVGASVIAGVILFRWLRAVVVGLGNGAPLRYILLYLCTLEILPFALAMEQAGDFVSLIANP